MNSVSQITVDGQYTPTPVTANASDTGNGGSSVVGAYQVSVGLNTSLFGTGWGAGTWGRNTWGSAASLTLTDVLRIWGHDNFGEDLVLNVQDEGVFYWDASAVSALDTRAVKLSTLAGAKSCPTKATKVIVSDRDRHVIAFGADGLVARMMQKATAFKTHCLYVLVTKRTQRIGSQHQRTLRVI